MMKNTVVGRPGTTMPIEPTPTATQPPANHSHRVDAHRRSPGADRSPDAHAVGASPRCRPTPGSPAARGRRARRPGRASARRSIRSAPSAPSCTDVSSPRRTAGASSSWATRRASSEPAARELGGQLGRQLDLHADLLARRVELDLQCLAQWLGRVGEHGRRVRSGRHAVAPRPLAAQQLERPQHVGVDADRPGVGLGGSWPAAGVALLARRRRARTSAASRSPSAVAARCSAAADQPALGGQSRAASRGRRRPPPR